MPVVTFPGIWPNMKQTQKDTSGLLKNTQFLETLRIITQNCPASPQDKLPTKRNLRPPQRLATGTLTCRVWNANKRLHNNPSSAPGDSQLKHHPTTAHTRDQHALELPQNHTHRLNEKRRTSVHYRVEKPAHAAAHTRAFSQDSPVLVRHVVLEVV